MANKRYIIIIMKRDAGNVTIKKRDPGSPASKMYNENLVVTVLDDKRNLRVQCLYRQNFFVLPETLQST